MSIILTDQQREAAYRAVTWYYTESEFKNIFTLSGCAGTGKTTVAKIIVKHMGLQPYQVIYVTPTGKAANVLRRKGIPANTMHKVFYITHVNNGKVFFSKKKKLSNTVKLIVLDEMSMVNKKMMEDLLSFNIPILGLGDNCQLPPIYGENPYMKNPDFFMDKIMRQSGLSGILILATMARTSQHISCGVYNESKVIYPCDLTDIEKYDIVICWKNSTRRELNKIIRTKKGYTNIYPQAGEKLVCLKNNYNHILSDETEDIEIIPVNGLDVINYDDSKIIDDNYLYMNYGPSFLKDSFKTRVKRSIFDMYNDLDNIIQESDEQVEEDSDDVVWLDYGYAMTTHKMQGSSSPNILVLDEFRGSEEIHNKWLYTAITRAEQSVTIVKYNK